MPSRDADVVVMAAAVADFRPAAYADAQDQEDARRRRRRRRPTSRRPTVALVRNPDVLAGLVARPGERRQRRSSSASPPRPATPTGSVLDHARAKLARKGCDLLVVNEVGVDKTFGHDDSTVHILRRGSDEVVDVGPASKVEVAHAVWDAVTPLLPDAR